MLAFSQLLSFYLPFPTPFFFSWAIGFKSCTADTVLAGFKKLSSACISEKFSFVQKKNTKEQKTNQYFQFSFEKKSSTAEITSRTCSDEPGCWVLIGLVVRSKQGVDQNGWLMNWTENSGSCDQPLLTEGEQFPGCFIDAADAGRAIRLLALILHNPLPDCASQTVIRHNTKHISSSIPLTLG